ERRSTRRRRGRWSGEGREASVKELLDQVRAWQAEGVELGRAVAIRSFGSTPRPEGASLVVTADGRLAGSVSGGCVEGAAAEEIQRARAGGVSRVIRYGISDQQAWDVGLACGGAIDVLVEPFLRPEVVEAATGPGGSAVVIPLPADAPGPDPRPHAPGQGEPPAPSMRVAQDGSLAGSTGSAEADAEIVRAALELLGRGRSGTVEAAGRQYFVESHAVAPRLVIVGAVQVAIPLVRFARELGYATVVIDGRAAFATRERFPDADALMVGWPDEVAEEIALGPADAVAVLTHDMKFDEPAIVAALRRGCRYVGAIGSRRTQAERRVRLLAAGVGEGDLARLRGPIGLDLGGRAPAETALAIMAEVVAERHGGSGAPMRTPRG
ncbi:MAG TPA: XdhC family protein, partial [Candidatus Nanopelagicales bacterium]|nr:XdhC family protein [Candidatus Nanopelagicales bacterium]